MSTSKSTSVNWEESQGLDYVTVAKAGGRKDLLVHVEAVSPPYQPYTPSVDWFAHPTPPPPHPDSHYQSVISKSWMQWCSPAHLPKVTEDKPRAHQRARSDPVKLPKITAGNDGVDFTRLLALDYQREWLEKREAKQAEQQRRSKLKRAAQKRKLREHTIKARKIAGVLKDPADTRDEGRFIMKRFANVPPRVKLPPLE